MEYIGEHLWVGQLGHFFIVLSFVSSILAIYAYFHAERQHLDSSGTQWKKLGRYAFMAHGISVFAIIGLIFYIMTERMYEYAYAFNHVSDDLPISYILSAFWEGQEGSFLLWMFWHVVLGMILLARGRSWENGVMLFLSMIQMVLASFLLGMYFGDTKIGINPFVLLRDTMPGAPVFQQADYLDKITGSGLNPLLQNYWMTIHPPTLFLGFASVAVPFCYAATGLWTKRYTQWLKPVLPWALFSAAVLGTGILMGGAWAYEALSFGGYWAWDPVENMSLVPWIIVVAGIHTNLVAKSTGHSVAATSIFYLLSFVLVFYSTFLTRSGVLGDSSVHAFTELGLEAHLLLGLFFFIGIAAYLYFSNRKKIPTKEKEESVSSKEFWMFIGSLVLLISAILISLTTSIPVFNKIMDGVGWLLNQEFDDLARPTDPIAHYNKYQIWIALLVGVFSGMTQFMRYRESNFAKWRPKFIKNMGISTVLAILLTIAAAQIIDMHAWQYYVLAFGCWFAVVSNLNYLITATKGNIKLAGSAFSHIGFGVMLIGSLISGLNQHHISTNTFAQKGIIEGFTEEDYNKNILLIKGKPMMMKGYEVTYEKDSIDGLYRYFTVSYLKKDTSGQVTESFTLQPNIIYEKTFQKVAASNPSTKHYVSKDIFTHVASLPRAETDPEYARTLEDSLEYASFSLLEGDTFSTANLEGALVGIVKNAQHPDYQAQPGDMALGVEVEVKDKETGKRYRVMPIAVVRGAKIIRFPATITDIGTKIKLTTEVFDEALVREDLLDYQAHTLKEGGGTFMHQGTPITFKGFGANPEHPDYQPKAGDQAFNALLEMEWEGQPYTARPIYLIRDKRIMKIKDEIKEAGFHFIVGDVNPDTEEITIFVAQSQPHQARITLQVAEDVPSSEYIVLEAIVFPGINLFWLGSIMMLVGMLLAMIRRWWL